MKEEIKEALILKLKNSSSKFESLMQNILELQEQQESYKNNMAREEMRMISEVANSKTMDGKATYTNQTQRDAALQKFKDSNVVYNDYRSEYEKYTKQIKDIYNQLDILKFQQRNNLKLVDLNLEV